MIVSISTSLSQFIVSISKDNEILCYKKRERIPNGETHIDLILKECLEELNMKVSDISALVVDVGPGGTSSVRTGVSFANGLSYSLDCPIIGISSVDIIGIENYLKYKKSICCLFKSVKGNYFAGFYDGMNTKFIYTKVEEITQYIRSSFSEIVLCGNKDIIQNLELKLADINVIISDIYKVNPEILATYAHKFLDKTRKYPNLPVPVTETNIQEWS